MSTTFEAPRLRQQTAYDTRSSDRCGSVKPRELPVYCSYCKGHVRGPVASDGVNGTDVSHGVCGPCAEMVRSGLNVRTIQEVREIELRVQLQALRKELLGSR